jgi:thymidylate synthase (FAD)
MNEYSARYSVLTDEFYIPELENIQPQSTSNKQGREEGEWDFQKKRDIQHAFQRSFHNAFKEYLLLLGKDDDGLARELARSVLPVGGYTECYWTANLKNFLHMARLRMDPHAQWEIRKFADAMYQLAKPLFPEACQAFEDYAVNTVKFSSGEFDLLKSLICSDKWATLTSKYGNDEKALGLDAGLGVRELKEFKAKLGL